MRWELVRCWVGGRAHYDLDAEVKLEDLLADGWEPFAVSSSGQAGYVYHLRRRTARP